MVAILKNRQGQTFYFQRMAVLSPDTSTVRQKSSQAASQIAQASNISNAVTGKTFRSALHTNPNARYVVCNEAEALQVFYNLRQFEAQLLAPSIHCQQGALLCLVAVLAARLALLAAQIP